jgi:hypothetical protein
VTTVHSADDVRRVVRGAFDAGVQGLKFQCPVQEAALDGPRLNPAYELCAEDDQPVLQHAGTAPMFEESPHIDVDRFRSFRESFPEVRACCAHMGAFEEPAFIEVARDDENVFFDTCFAMSTAVDDYIDFNPASVDDAVFEDLARRVLYGPDHPNSRTPTASSTTGYWPASSWTRPPTPCSGRPPRDFSAADDPTATPAIRYPPSRVGSPVSQRSLGVHRRRHLDDDDPVAGLVGMGGADRRRISTSLSRPFERTAVTLHEIPSWRT